MEKLSIEQKAKRYDEVSKEVKDFFEGRRKMYSDVIQTLEYLFPELKESNDERIRKKLLNMLNDMERDKSILDEYGLDKLKTIAWLEKQESVEEIVERSKTSWFNAGKIQGKMEGLSDEEKYQQGWHDAIEKQGEQKLAKKYGITDIGSKHAQGKLCEMIKKKIETETVDNANKVEPKFHEGDTIVEKDFFECDYEIIKDIKDGKYIFTDGSTMNINEQDGWLLVKPPTVIEQNLTDKVESKLNVGDWIVQENIGVYQVIEVCKSWYEVVDNKDKNYSIGFDKEYMLRHWTIADAKDGDVLVHSSFMFGDFIFIYNNTSILQAYCYYSIERNRFIIEDRGHYCPWNMQEVKPATKEQRDLLFSKMKEAGYEWDAEKKELKKI